MDYYFRDINSKNLVKYELLSDAESMKGNPDYEVATEKEWKEYEARWAKIMREEAAKE